MLPTPDGVITLTLKDASQCFNLNSVVTAVGKKPEAARREFAQIAELLGLAENQATSLSNALVDWQDADQLQRLCRELAAEVAKSRGSGISTAEGSHGRPLAVVEWATVHLVDKGMHPHHLIVRKGR